MQESCQRRWSRGPKLHQRRPELACPPLSMRKSVPEMRYDMTLLVASKQIDSVHLNVQFTQATVLAWLGLDLTSFVLSSSSPVTHSGSDWGVFMQGKKNSQLHYLAVFWLSEIRFSGSNMFTRILKVLPCVQLGPCRLTDNWNAEGISQAWKFHSMYKHTDSWSRDSRGKSLSVILPWR